MTNDQRDEMKDVLNSVSQADLLEIATMAAQRINDKESILNLHRTVGELYSVAQHRAVVIAKRSLRIGMDCTIVDVRDVAVIGTQVKILQINKTRADVRTVTASNKYPVGAKITVPLGCLKPV